MAQRTMLLRNIPKDCSADRILQEFKQFTVKRIMNESRTTGRAYIQFYEPSDIVMVADKYPDCVIPSLNNAELQLVEVGFNWQQIFAESKEQPMFEVNQKCLVRLKNCSNVKDIDEGTVRSVFKKFAIGKIVKFVEKNQIILQFLSEDDLELLDITFDDCLVPGLGNNAVIDLEQEVNKQLFIKQYYATQPKPESIFIQKVQKVQPIVKEMTEAKRQFNRQQYQDYRETVQEKQQVETMVEKAKEVKRSFNRQQYQEYRQTVEEKQESERLKKQMEAIEREEIIKRQQEERKRKEEEERKIAEEKVRRQAEEKNKKQLQQKLKKQAEQHARKIQAAKKQAEAKEAQLIRAKNEGEERARKFYEQKLKKAEEQAKIEAEAKIKQEAAKKQAENQRKTQAALEEKMKIQKQQQLKRKKEQEAWFAKAALQEKAKLQRQNKQRLRKEEEIRLAKELERQNAKLTDSIKVETKIVQPELEKLIEQQRVQTAQKSESVLNRQDSSPKKQIYLPLINTFTPVIQKELFKAEIEADKRPEIKYPEIEASLQSGIKFSSSLPTYFMTLVLLGWVYYILMH